jgi:hypothetical protein
MGAWEAVSKQDMVYPCDRKEVAMKRLTEPIGILFLMIAFALAAGRTSSGNLTGVVLDSKGTVISNAIVLVHWDTDGSQGGAADAPADLRM